MTLNQLQIDDIADHAEMRQRLRKVAEERAARCIDLLGIQADIIGASDQMFDRGARRIDVAACELGVDQPRSADQELTLAADDSVLADIAREKFAATEHLPNALDRSAQRSFGQRKTEHRRQ